MRTALLMKLLSDAYGEDEQAMGWYNYLEEKLKFPFTARCINEEIYVSFASRQ